MPVINNSVLPILRFLTNKRIDHVTITNDEIISLIRKINPNKATVSDGIFGQMLLLCDESVILPLQVIFTNILSTSINPNMWKLANVTPIFKRGVTNNSSKIIDQYHFSLFVERFLKILFLIIFTLTFIQTIL